MYSTTSVSPTFQGVDTENLSSQTLTSLPYWIRLALDRMDPYSPYRYDPQSSIMSALSAIPATCGQIWSASYVQWATMEVANGLISVTDSIECYTPSSFSPYCQTWEIYTTLPPALITVTEVIDCYTPPSSIVPHCQTWETANTYPDFPFTASAPCCGTCVFTAGDVQVYHWPQSTTVPSVSMLVNSNGFTFIYPSVYVAFQSILATDMCGVVDSAIVVTTIGFDMKDLSTAPAYYDFSSVEATRLTSQSWWSYSAIDYPDSMTCINIVTTFWEPPGGDRIQTFSTYSIYTMIERSWVGGTKLESSEVDTDYSTFTTTYTLPWDPWTLTYNPCSPYLSIPPQILTLDPRWNTCLRWFKGLHDPPTILTTANGFFAVTMALAPTNPTETNGAATAQAVQQTMATKTAAPGTQPTPSSGDDPSLGRPSQRMSKPPAIITIGGTAITANSASAFVIGTQTLAPGQEITAAGTLLSMAPDGQTVFSGETTIVVGGFGAGERTKSGSASGKREGNHWIIWQVALCIIIMVSMRH